MLGVVDLQSGRVVLYIFEGERRIAVSAVRPERIEPHAPGPAQHPDIEIKQ